MISKHDSKSEYWVKKNHYYHDYVKSFVDFLIPAGKKVFDAKKDADFVGFEKESFDYIIASDVLGHVSDVEKFLSDASRALRTDGRVVITQYSHLWEPILSLASKLGLRRPVKEQNWLSLIDLKNFAYLAGFETVKSGTKMLAPKYIPLVSVFLNKIVANIFPFTHLGLFHYLVLRPAPHKATQDNLPSVSIIVAARNEAGTIKKIIHDLPTLGAFTEIVFVEGGSKDNTREVIQKEIAEYAGDKKLSYYIQSGKGKGDAVRKGFDAAAGDILIVYDGDMTVPANEIYKFYDAIVSGKGDFINGSRLVYPMEKKSMRFANIVANKFFSLAFSWVLNQPIKDTLCGTKVLWKKDYEAIKQNRKFFGDFDPFGDFDLLFGAAKLNLKIIDLPVHYKDRTYGTTNISRWRHGVLLLRMTIFAARKIKLI